MEKYRLFLFIIIQSFSSHPVLNKNNFYKHKYNFHIENEQVVTFLNPSVFQGPFCTRDTHK